MIIDQGIKDLKYDLKEYNYEYSFLYHEGCDRLTVDKKDGSEHYTFDIWNHKDDGEFLCIEWGLPRKIIKDGKTEVSLLDPEVWEFIEGCDKEGPMFGNSITGGWATFDKETGKVKLLSKGHTPKFDPVEITRRISKVNTSIKEINKRSKSKNKSKLTDAEIKARTTLRDQISEKEWKRYITNGYILVKGGSGKVYQVFANHKGRHIKVYEKGKHIHELCIHSEGVPDTDHVLTCMLIIQSDEDDFIKQCNKHSANSYTPDWDGRDSRYKDKSLKEILATNKRIAEKLKVPEDWIDATEERTKEFEKAKNEIEEKLSIRRGLRDVAAGRVVPAEEVIEALGDMLDDVDRNPQPRQRALRGDRLNPEQQEDMNEVFYDIIGEDFFKDEPRVAQAN